MTTDRITDFLRLNDGEFIAYALQEPLLQWKMQRLMNRTLLKRALHISASVIAGPPEETAYSDLVQLGSGKPEAQAEIRRLREQIFDSLPPQARIEPWGKKRELDVSDVWVDIPKTPLVSKDVSRCYVNTGEDNPLQLKELFPIDAWLQAYAENKWTAHVFGYPAEEPLKAANRAAISILQERFQLKFSPRASRECKLEHPDI